MGADITIRVTHETWQQLHDQKDPGDSFNDVLRRLLDGSDGAATDELPVES